MDALKNPNNCMACKHRCVQTVKDQPGMTQLFCWFTPPDSIPLGQDEQGTMHALPVRQQTLPWWTCGHWAEGEGFEILVQEKPKVVIANPGFVHPPGRA